MMMMMMMIMMITMTQREALDSPAVAAAAAALVVDEGFHSCSYRFPPVVVVGLCVVFDDVLICNLIISW
jgi:hypothetical protein